MARETKRSGGDISREVRRTGGDVSRETQRFGGDVSRETKRFGGDVSREVQRAGGDVARETKRFGGDVAREVKPVGGIIADAGKQFGGTISREAKNLGGELSESSKRIQRELGHPTPPDLNPVREANRVAKDVSRELNAAGGEIADASQRIQKEVGRPWVRGVRDPWVRWLERGYNTGQDKLDQTSEQTQRGIVDGASNIPSFATGREFDSDVPNGKESTSPYGKEVKQVDAPTGGTIGVEIPMAMEGRDVEVTMWIIVEKGAVHPGLGHGLDDVLDHPEGHEKTTLSTTEKLKAAGMSPREIEAIRAANGGLLPEIKEVSFTTHVPSDGQGYGGTNSVHDYQALLTLDPGSKVHVIGSVVKRA